MQDESTPSRQVSGNIVTPHSTAVQRQNGRRRKTVETPLRKYCHNTETTVCSDQFTPDTSIPRISDQPFAPSSATAQHHKDFYSDTRDGNASKDIFFDNLDVLTPQRRHPALQFHEAAKRLALESIHAKDETTVSPSKRNGIARGPTCNAAKPHNFSRKLRNGSNISKAPLPKGPQEWDITSARRNESKSSVREHNLATPIKCQQYLELTTPISKHQNGQLVRDASVHSVPRPRNYSRPVRIAKPQVSEQVTCTTRILRKLTSNGNDGPKPLNSPVVKLTEVSTKAQTVMPSSEKKPVSRQIYAQTPIMGGKPKQYNDESTTPIGFEEIIRPSDYVRNEDLTDHRRQLKHWQIWLQRITIMCIVLGINLGLALAYFRSFKHPYLLGILVFMKSKDILSTVADLLGVLHYHFHRLIWPPKDPDTRWILSLVCAYAETEEQIMKTVESLATNVTTPHKQVICIILDGKPRDVVSKMDAVRVEFERPYVTWRGVQGSLRVSAGIIKAIPIILICKTKNAGKKDSLILGHDLFNFPRKDMPQSTRLLRQEIWQLTMPHLVPKTRLTAFDFIFCTDADSTIHERCLQKLANALCQTSGAIAACGVLFAEFGNKWTEYSPWHLFQQFQYTFGQYVRRQAESTFGRVTCLPGCVTMIVVRPELGDALSEYARPVTGRNLLRHQVQYLGTDRRLTWCMLSQNKHLRTIFVPEALSETVTPSGLSHYLSQRRRWASNAYFNDFFYLFGPQQRLATRLFAAIDIVRLTLVFYRVFNTAYFIHGLATNFYVIKIIPTLIVTKTPATWYLLLMLIKEPLLRKRIHKILLGMAINQIMSPILSVIVFTNVLFHVGSQAWGKTGASTQGKPVASLHFNAEASKPWSPTRLARSVREAIRGITPGRLQSTETGMSHEPATVTPSGPKKKASFTMMPSQESVRSRNTSTLEDAIAEDKHSPDHGLSTSHQTPARKLFQDANSTSASLYRRNPGRATQFSTAPQVTPTRDIKQKLGTEFDFNG